MNQLGELLERLRGKMSLREVAEKTGLSHTYIRDLELGIRRGSGTEIRPSPDTLKKLADCYNYSFHELMQLAGYPGGENMTNEEMAAIAEAVRASLKPDFKEIMDGLREIKERVDRIEEKVINLEKKLDETEITTAFLAKDVYMLKNKAK